MCKVLIIFTILALFILFLGSINAQEVLWNVNISPSYLWNNGGIPTVIPNIPIIIEIEAGNNTPDPIYGFSASWQIHGHGPVNTVNWISSAGGAGGGGSIVLTNGFQGGAFWDGLNVINTWSWTGNLPDTVNHSTVAFSAGWPAGSLLQTHYEFYLSIPLGPGLLGEICIDSTDFWDSTYDWLFPVVSNFGGPYCWFVEEPPINYQPVINNLDASLTVQHHQNFSESYWISDLEGNAITSVSATDINGNPLGTATHVKYTYDYINWFYDPPCDSAGKTYQVFLSADDGYPHPIITLYVIDLNVLNSAPDMGGDAGKTLRVHVNTTGTASFPALDANVSSPDEYLFYTLISANPPPNGTAIIYPPTGDFEFSPTTLDNNQTFTFAIGVTDCAGDEDICEVKFIVRDVNDIGFRPNPDGWQFSNSSNNMWPSSWYQQFDYDNPPYTSAFTGIKSNSFPDWPLFVDAFGKNQCYIYNVSGTTTFRSSAVTLWTSIIGPWGCSCFGSATSSFLHFDGFLDISKTFPGNADIYSIPIADSSRKLINKYCIHQLGKNHKQYSINSLKRTPKETLDDCLAMINSSVFDDRILIMGNNSVPGWGGHAVIPYRCENDPVWSDIWFIYVYDSNYPNDFTKMIMVDKGSNTWYYDPLPSWGGFEKLFLMEPVSYYLSNPLRSDSAGRENSSDNAGFLWDDTHTDFYFSEIDSILFESPSGSIGHYEDFLIDKVEDGMPITLLSCQETPPIGYYLPNDNWECFIGGMLNPTFRISIFANTTVWTYRRDDVDETQHEHLKVEDNNRSLMLWNPDDADRYYQLEVIEAAIDSEIVWTVSAIELAAKDSIGFSIIAGERQGMQMQIDNYGETGSYNLGTKVSGYYGNFDFSGNAISIPGNSSQRIFPDGRVNDNSVMIITDPDMTGVYTDTSLVSNGWPLSAICGDVNNDDIVNIFDIVFLINYKYKNGPYPISMNIADVNGDGLVDILDVVYLINYKYKEGPGPDCP